jgi:hypothetical protein
MPDIQTVALSDAEKEVVEAAIVYLNTGPKAPHGGTYEGTLRVLQEAVAKVLKLREEATLCDCGHPLHEGRQCAWFWGRPPHDRPTQCMCGLKASFVTLPGTTITMLTKEEYESLVQAKPPT